MGTLSDWEIIQEVRRGKHFVWRVGTPDQKRVYALGIKFFRNGEDARDFTRGLFKGTNGSVLSRGIRVLYMAIPGCILLRGKLESKRKPSVSMPKISISIRRNQDPNPCIYRKSSCCPGASPGKRCRNDTGSVSNCIFRSACLSGHFWNHGHSPGTVKSMCFGQRINYGDVKRHRSGGAL
jgi:hypothetical protein